MPEAHFYFTLPSSDNTIATFSIIALAAFNAKAVIYHVYSAHEAFSIYSRIPSSFLSIHFVFNSIKSFLIPSVCDFYAETTNGFI